MGNGSSVNHKLNQEYAHGGNIYDNRVELDFSVNVNPLGVPEGVRKAMQEAVEHCAQYPEPGSRKLQETLGNCTGLQAEQILFGNGASELFLAIVHALRPRKIVIPVPSFYGYEHAAGALGDATLVQYYEMREQNGFRPDESIYEVLDGQGDLLFLANPNNPVGNLMDRDFLKKLLEYCRQKGIYVVLDECFMGLCPKGEGHSFLRQVESYPNLFVVRAFTKTYGIPGVRLGYLVCGDLELAKWVGRQLPEWNVSLVAQTAGLAALKEIAEADEAGQKDKNYPVQSGEQIAVWRRELEAALRQFGFTVYEGEANYVFFKAAIPLYEKLLEKGILIRDCANYRGLGKGFYRVSVRTGEENEKLVRAIAEIVRSI